MIDPDTIKNLSKFLQEKEELIDTIVRQSKDDITNKIISPEVGMLLSKAAMNVQQGKLALQSGDIETAIYTFGRCSWNLGEFMGKARAAKEQHKKN